MQFGLTRKVLESNSFVDITEAEINDVVRAKDGLLSTLFVEEKFDLLVENYLELENSFLESTSRHMVLRNQNYEWYQVERNLFNRRLVNLLSAARSYIDYSKHHIGVIFPNQCGTRRQLESVFSRYYDASFGYRVMEALRNFVQHRGFPIHAITYPAKLYGQEEDQIFGLSVYTKTNYLREDGEFKKTVLEELDRLGGRVNVKPLLREYVAILGNIHEELRAASKGSVDAWDACFINAIERFKAAFPNEGSVVGLKAVKFGIEGSEEISIFSDFLNYRRSLERKNHSLSILRKGYVTGETLKNDA